MTRGTSSTVTTPFRSADDAQPVWLVKVVYGSGTLRYTNWDAAVTWDSATWTPRPLDLPEQRIESQSEAGGIALRIGDADRALGAIVEAGETFGNRRVTIVLTDAAALGGSGTAGVRNDYLCESYERGEGFLVLNLRPLFAVFSQEVPLRVFTRTEFPGLPPNPMVM